MADKPVKHHHFHFAWSTICPGDFGLKVGLWSKEEGETMEFREIVGWVTIVSKDVASRVSAPENGFHAVILDNTSYPTVARTQAKYSGVFPKHMSEDQAKALVREWTRAKSAHHAQPNMSGVGVA